MRAVGLLALQLPAFDEGIDHLQHLALLVGIELLDGQQAPAQARIALLLHKALPGGRPAVELVDRHAQHLGEGWQQMRRRRGARALVVRHHALGDPEFGGQLDLREAGGLAQLRQAFVEAGGHWLRRLDVRCPQKLAT